MQLTYVADKAWVDVVADVVHDKQRVVWTVAGFDPSGGAGITADLMTFAAHGLFGCSAITALTVQSTTGVRGTELVRREQLRDTLACLLDDLPPAGVKIGMLGGRSIAGVVGAFLRTMRAHGLPCPVVLDPVLRSSSGRMLYPLEGIELLHEIVLPQVDWTTPNWGELAVLSGLPVRDEAEVDYAVRQLQERHPHLGVVATAGDQAHPTDLLFTTGCAAVRVEGARVETNSTHGTGCAFSSAFLARLVLGAEPEEAARRAKAFVAGALRHAPGLGGGRGPMGLLWPLR